MKLQKQFNFECKFHLQLYTGPNQSYEIKGLTPATLYLFRVQVCSLIHSCNLIYFCLLQVSEVLKCFTQTFNIVSVDIHVRASFFMNLLIFQAINSAGQGPYSPVASCVTPPSSPSSVTIHRHTATATSITLFWKEPNSNGNDITAYNLEVGDKQFTIGAVTEYTIETLQPETPHK